jgi:hypothetical protein
MSLHVKMLFLVVMLAGCTGRGVLPDGGALPDAGTPAAQVYSKRCGICHAVPHPARHSDTGWLRLLPLMEQRMAERGIRPLTDKERSDILRYLQAHAR